MRNLSKIIPLLPLAIFFIIALDYKLSALFFPNYYLYDIKRILEIILLLYIGLYLLISFRGRYACLELYNRFPSKVRLIILSIFALGIFSALLAPIPRMALLTVAQFFLIFCFIVFIAMKRVTIGVLADRFIIFIVILGIVVYEFVYFSGYLSTLLTSDKFNYFLGFVNSRFLAQYQAWTLPLVTLPIFLVTEKRSAMRTSIVALTYVFASLFWAIAIMNACRGMFLGLLVAGIFTGFVFRRASRRWLTVQIQVIIFGFILYLLFKLMAPHTITVAEKILNVESIFQRFTLWKHAIYLIFTHPLLGVGPMHLCYYPNPIATHPHDSLLQIATEWGLPVVILILTLFIYGLISWLKKFNYRTLSNTEISNRVVPIALTASLIAASCHSLFSGTIVMPMSQVMLGLVIGWILGVYYAGQKECVLKYRLTAEIIFSLFVCLAMVGIVYGIIPEVFFLRPLEIKWILDHKIGNEPLLFHPNFWIQGWIY
jgi:putative inorganic carbon (HCO3(-)) transporter